MECLKTRMNTTRQNWQLFSKNMSNDIIEHIIGLAGETQKASTFNDGDTKVRSSRVCWLSHYENVKDMLFATSFTFPDEGAIIGEPCFWAISIP